MSTGTIDEKDLVTRCRQGNDDAWRELVDRFGQKVYAIAYHFTLKREDAEELSQEIFLKLFTRPFGPRALASYSADVSAAPAPVFGVSREDADRMDLLLGQIEGAEHGQRMLTGAVALSVGVLYGALAASWFALDRSVPDTTKTGADTVGGMFAGLGALSLAYGTYAFARPWAGERMASEYRSALGRGDYARAFALANERLDSIAALEAKQRWVRGIAGGLVVLASAAAIVADEVSDASVNARLNARAFGGAGVLLGATAIASAALIESPIGRLTTVWRRDPSLIHFQPVVTPVAGGATVGLVGRF